MNAVILLIIMLGGGLGAVLRYLTVIVGERVGGATFPWGTLACNALGCLLIGVVAALAIPVPEGREPMSVGMRHFLLTGVLGGFTTFSSFSLQSLVLWREGHLLWASAYVAASVFLCLLLVALSYHATLWAKGFLP